MGSIVVSEIISLIEASVYGVFGSVLTLASGDRLIDPGETNFL